MGPWDGARRRPPIFTPSLQRRTTLLIWCSGALVEKPSPGFGCFPTRLVELRKASACHKMQRKEAWRKLNDQSVGAPDGSNNAVRVPRQSLCLCAHPRRELPVARRPWNEARFGRAVAQTVSRLWSLQEMTEAQWWRNRGGGVEDGE